MSLFLQRAPRPPPGPGARRDLLSDYHTISRPANQSFSGDFPEQAISHSGRASSPRTRAPSEEAPLLQPLLRRRDRSALRDDARRSRATAPTVRPRALALRLQRAALLIHQAGGDLLRVALVIE